MSKQGTAIRLRTGREREKEIHRLWTMCTLSSRCHFTSFAEGNLTLFLSLSFLDARNKERGENSCQLQPMRINFNLLLPILKT